MFWCQPKIVGDGVDRWRWRPDQVEPGDKEAQVEGFGSGHNTSEISVGYEVPKARQSRKSQLFQLCSRLAQETTLVPYLEDHGT